VGILKIVDGLGSGINGLIFSSFSRRVGTNIVVSFGFGDNLKEC
jgi:hypothetical protein